MTVSSKVRILMALTMSCLQLGCTFNFIGPSVNYAPSQVSWSPDFKTNSITGAEKKTLEFQVTREMVQGLPDEKIAVTFQSGSASLVECERLNDRPAYDDPYTLLLKLSATAINYPPLYNLRNYLKNHTKYADSYELLAIRYYQPPTKNEAGELLPFCQNGRASTTKTTTHYLAPGRYRVVISSYAEFYTEIVLSCRPKSCPATIRIMASDEDEMRYLYRNSPPH